jgi:hypothetical protein
MVYNTYYGMGYNNTTLKKSRFEMNSYPTQVAQLQFEYIHELDKNMFSWTRYGSRWSKDLAYIDLSRYNVEVAILCLAKFWIEFRDKIL